MSESPAPAVFLSYASQDAEAAKRICEALRAAGVEVWFDLNELRGGDSWDAKIRKQIKECALFVPMISANTNARPEGYFRLEWKLAVDRSHLLAEDHPFLFPIAIGDVDDATARVPDKFREVQWTRLRLEETPTELAARVAKLLATDGSAVGQTHSETRKERRASGEQKAGLWRWWMIFPIFGMAMGLLVVGRPMWRSLEGPKTNHAAAAPRTKAQQLTDQARELYEPWNLATSDDFKFADRLLKEATELEISNGEAWAALAIESYGQNVFGFDRSEARDETQRNATDRAVRLAPESDQAKLALALKYRRMPGNDEDALKILRELAARRGTDRLILHQWGRALEVTHHFEEALAVYGRIAALPGDDAAAHMSRAVTLEALGRSDEMMAELDRAIELRPDFSMAHINRVLRFFFSEGDGEHVKAALQRIPSKAMADERVASIAAFMWYWMHEPEKADEALRHITRDYIESNVVTMPKAMLTGLVHRLAGRQEAAAAEWRAGVRVIDQRLAANSTHWGNLADKAFLLALLGDRPEAEAGLRLSEEIRRVPVGKAVQGTWRIYLELGRDEVLFDYLREELTPAKIKDSQFPALLRFEPGFDRLRNDPRFRELMVSVDQYFAARAAKK